MGHRGRQVRRQLGLAFATGLTLIMSAAVPGSAPGTAAVRTPGPEFQFVRLAYSDNPNFSFGRFGGYGAWTIDAPEAEEHFMQGVHRLTRINAGDDSIGLRPIDDEIFNYPWLYAVEVGRWELSDEDAAHLREYLLRGGFLMVDDFHGTVQWEGFMESMRRVFPDREVVEIPDEHEVFHVVYDLDHKIQIPGLAALMSGRTYEQDGVEPHWRGIFDDDGLSLIHI